MILNHHMQNKKVYKLKDQAGIAAIEFALVLILLLMIVGAIIEFGRVFWYYDALTKATRDGARQMSLLETFDDLGDVESLVVLEANNAGVSPALTTANVECLNSAFSPVACSDDEPPEYVRVSIDFEVVIGGWIPILTPTGEANDFGAVTLSPQTTMRYMP